jgi:hypothetical protein
MMMNADAIATPIGYYAVCRVRHGKKLILLHCVVQERRLGKDDGEFGMTCA